MPRLLHPNFVWMENALGDIQNKTPDSLEQTMTIGQLFDASNNLWAKSMSLEQLEKIYYIQHFSKKELIRERIQEVFDGKLI